MSVSRQYFYFFAGDKSTGANDLWISDGTSAGTYEIGGLADAGVTGVSGLGFQTTSAAALNGGVVFEGADAAGTWDLWYSNGTVKGTIEIGGLKSAGLTGVGSSNGIPSFTPYNFWVFGSKALFSGWDTSNHYGLWVTDGTTAGTFELGGVNNAGLGAYFGGLSAAHFVSFGNKVLFDARDSNNFDGLWITDGTVSGTFEIGGLKNGGLSSTGGSLLFSQTLGNNKVVFEWSDGSGQELWVSDGTTAGTVEIGGKNNSGITGVDPGLLVSGPMTAWGNRVVFAGADSSFFVGLWVTDGTVSGTYEIGGTGGTGIVNADQNSSGFYPRDITAFGNKVLFQGRDSAGYYGLWITDGTSVGTSELGGLKSVGIANAGINFAPYDITVLGSKAIFEATDASGQLTLWVTDGTAGGTSEIGGLNNKGVTGSASGGLAAIGTTVPNTANQSATFTVDGTYVSFQAKDSSGLTALWVSDGTVAGTYEINKPAGAPTTGLSPANLLPGAPIPTIAALPNAISGLVHANDLTHSSTVTIPTVTQNGAIKVLDFIDGLDYIASYSDLIRAFGTNVAAGTQHFNSSAFAENRVTTFDGLDYVASFGDLRAAFKSVGNMSAVEDAGAIHFIQSGFSEGRKTTFNGLDYIASYADLISSFGANNDAGAFHYIESGASEGRTVSFDGLDYIASNSDLIAAFGANEQAGAVHYITTGYNEGRSITFNGLDYIASYSDLIHALGANGDAGATHYINSGSHEGRTTTFDGLDYIASFADLIAAFGTNEQAGAAHYINSGLNEGRKTTFDGLAYIAANADLMMALGASNDAGATHYIQIGHYEGRATTINFSSYISTHSDLAGLYSTADQFYTAYINTYRTTGHVLT